MLVGESRSIQKIRELIRQVVNSDLNVLICGETGVGKEVVASALHLMSERRNEPLVKVNCSAIPSQLLESELFGYEKGAFTGADRTKVGKFELAHKGTIFLDEIGDMPLALQAKMLQALQDYQFSPLGSKGDIKVNCWVLAATNQDLERRTEEGLFRKDLYYRLNIIKIYIPPLRARREDIEPLVRFFARQYSKDSKIPFSRISQNGMMNFLHAYSWPGNVRELKNTVKRLMVLGDWETVKGELIARETNQDSPYNYEKGQDLLTPAEREPSEKSTSKKDFPSLKDVQKKAIREAESKVILEVLQETRWNRKRAAEILEISYKALLYKIKDYNLTATGRLEMVVNL
jgi:two-component system response regulator AtoC